jgi:hypothetical protein
MWSYRSVGTFSNEASNSFQNISPHNLFNVCINNTSKWQRKFGYQMENEAANFGMNFVILIRNIDKDIGSLNLRRNKQITTHYYRTFCGGSLKLCISLTLWALNLYISLTWRDVIVSVSNKAWWRSVHYVLCLLGTSLHILVTNPGSALKNSIGQWTTLVQRTNTIASLRSLTLGQQGKEEWRVQNAGVECNHPSEKAGRQLSVQCLKRVNRLVKVHEILVKTDFCW